MSVTPSQAVRRLLHIADGVSGSSPDLGVLKPPEWMADGLCAQVDPELFYPEKGGSSKEAKSVCRACPVRAECLEFALERDERFGVYGGLSERERRRLKLTGRTEQSATCPRCKATFATGQGMKVHMRRSHGSVAA